jgi:hypothetical protein
MQKQISLNNRYVHRYYSWFGGEAQLSSVRARVDKVRTGSDSDRVVETVKALLVERLLLMMV